MTRPLAWWHLLTRRFSRRRRAERARLDDTQEYHARHLIQRTLADQAELRRRAPASPGAAMRYRSLLKLELASLEELEQALREHMVGPEAENVLLEVNAELEQLRTEIAWCHLLLGEHRRSAAAAAATAAASTPRA
ncbi:MAG TPA: hypothetical protein VFS40_05395 [Gemmatimonadales bacterium]|nr:hypothetical protein [Gemmatimonadales bacterium]